MGSKDLFSLDIEVILSHRYDNGPDLWTTDDNKLLKSAPFTTLESVLYLKELGMPITDKIMQDTATLIFKNQKVDGRFTLAPKSAIYPCKTALALKTLCYLGYAADERLNKTFQYFLQTQQTDGGWKCNKYSFGKGPETNYSTPFTTLLVLDAIRFTPLLNVETKFDRAVEFLLEHFVIRKPISPCHYGIGTLFMQVEYPMRSYNLFYYVYVLSHYNYAKNDKRFHSALETLKSKLVDNQIVVQRVVPKLANLNFCKKNEKSILATQRYNEILKNID